MRVGRNYGIKCQSRKKDVLDTSTVLVRSSYDASWTLCRAVLTEVKREAQAERSSSAVIKERDPADVRRRS